MMTAGRIGALVLVAALAGFVGGVWSAATGYIDRIIARPTPVAPATGPGPTPRPMTIAPPQPPKVAAVAVPPRRTYSGGNNFGLSAGRIDLLPSPGCTWEVDPRAFRLDHAWHETTPDHTLVVYATTDSRGDGLNVLLSQTSRKGASNVPLRFVAFDEDGSRRVSRPARGGSSRGSDGQLEVAISHLTGADGEDPGKIAYFGIERVAPDAEQQAVAAAQAAAKERKMAILPPARVGEPYPFDLATVDGKRVGDKDLRGKAVILCVDGPGPFGGHSLLFAKQAIESNAPGEVAVISISFDATAEGPRKSLQRLGLDVPLVLVPNDAASRRIWIEGGQIDHLSAWFLLDRDGILRFTNSNGFNLVDHVSDIYGRPRRFPFTSRSFVGPPRILPVPKPPNPVIRAGGSPPTRATRPGPGPTPAGPR